MARLLLIISERKKGKKKIRKKKDKGPQFNEPKKRKHFFFFVGDDCLPLPPPSLSKFSKCGFTFVCVCPNEWVWMSLMVSNRILKCHFVLCRKALVGKERRVGWNPNRINTHYSHFQRRKKKRFSTLSLCDLPNCLLAKPNKKRAIA